MKNSEKLAKRFDKSAHVAQYSHTNIEISNLIII